MKVGLVGLAVALVTGPASFVTHAPQDEGDLDARIEALAQEALADGAAGLSVVVELGGDELLARGWGHIGRRRADATPDSAVRAGVLTAPFLAVAVLQLAEGGQLDLDADVRTLLADFPFEDETITLRQLLAHTSGLPSHGELAAGRERIDADALNAWLAKQPLQANPGDCQELSWTNVLLLGRIVETLTDTSVPARLTEHVFARAGMQATGYEDDGPAFQEQAGFAQEFAGTLVDLSDAPRPFEAARLCTSARDLARWQRALVRRELVGEASYRRLAEPAELASGQRTSTSCGLNLTPLGDHACLSTGGTSYGASVHVAYYPETDLTIALTAEGDDVPVRQLERRIARAFLGLPDPELLDVRLEPAARARYVGTYYVGCTAYRVDEADEHVRLLEPEGATLRLLYQGGQIFVAADDPEVRLRFELEEGAVVGFQLDEHGATSHAKRLP